jgi:hypothetical protein
MKLARKALLAAAIGLAMAVPALADDDSSALFADAAEPSAAPAAAPASTEAAPSGSEFTLGLQGSHEFGYHFPAYDNDSRNYDSVMKAPYFSNEFDITVQDKELKLVSNWNATLRPLDTDSTNEYGSYDGSWDRLAKAKALENYVSWSPKGWKFSAGYQIFSWGVADKRNPTDNLNPRDYSVGVNADKIPVLAADAIWYPTDSFSVEGVFLPAAQDSVYPIDWAAQTDAGNTQISSALSYALSEKYLHSASGITVKPEATTYSDPAFKPANSIVGTKLSYHSAAFDASLSYLYDIDPLYTPVVSVSYNASKLPTSATVSLERERIHRFGGDFKTTLGKYGLWTEVCYSLTRNSGSSDYEYRRSKLDYVIGGDVNYGPNDTIYTNLQYIGAWIPGYDDSFYEDYLAGKITDPAEAYQRALLEGLGLDTEGLLQGVTTNFKWELLNGELTPQLTAVYAVPFNYDKKTASGEDYKRYGALALNPELDIKPVDSFHIKIGADLAYAWYKVGDGDVKLDTSTDKIGVYSPSNNVYMKILYKWNYDLKK